MRERVCVCECVCVVYSVYKCGVCVVYSVYKCGVCVCVCVLLCVLCVYVCVCLYLSVLILIYRIIFTKSCCCMLHHVKLLKINKFNKPICMIFCKVYLRFYKY